MWLWVMGNFKTEVNKEQEKQLLEISLLLFRAKLITAPTKYAVTKYALLNLITGINKGLEKTIAEVEEHARQNKNR